MLAPWSSVNEKWPIVDRCREWMFENSWYVWTCTSSNTCKFFQLFFSFFISFNSSTLMYTISHFLWLRKFLPPGLQIKKWNCPVLESRFEHWPTESLDGNCWVRLWADCRKRIGVYVSSETARDKSGFASGIFVARHSHIILLLACLTRDRICSHLKT